MPLGADTSDALSGTQYFTALNLKSGYWQIELCIFDCTLTLIRRSHLLFIPTQ